MKRKHEYERKKSVNHAEKRDKKQEREKKISSVDHARKGKKICKRKSKIERKVVCRMDGEEKKRETE